jgi:AraC family ethanolamine operon transcriptional activator
MFAMNMKGETVSAVDGDAASHDPGRSFVRRLSDFEEIAEFFSGWDGRFEQLSAGRFEGRLSLVRGRAVRLVSLNCDQVILARGRSAPGLFALYSVTPANAGGRWQGRRLSPGQVVVHGPDADTNHLSSRRFASVGFSVPADFMEAAARPLTATDLAEWPRGWAALSPRPDLYTDLNARIQRFLDLATADPTILAAPEGEQLES